MTLLMIGTSEIIFIALIVLLLFGGKKIPELMNGLGKGVRSFKQGINGEDGEPKTDVKNDPAASEPAASEPAAANDETVTPSEDGKE